jgi:hypothetical protein
MRRIYTSISDLVKEGGDGAGFLGLDTLRGLQD